MLFHDTKKTIIYNGKYIMVFLVGGIYMKIEYINLSNIIVSVYTYNLIKVL